MDIRITASYVATDGRMPEGVDVTLEGVELGGDTAATLSAVLDMLLMAPSARYSLSMKADIPDRSAAMDTLRAAWEAKEAAGGGARLRGMADAKDATDLAEQMRQEERSELQSVQLDRICLRIGCGHAEEGHGASVCTLCPTDRPCAGFVGTTPARLTSAVQAHRGEMLAATTDGYVRQSVDARVALMLGTAASGFKTGDALTWLPPAGSSGFGTWIRRDAA